MSAVFAISLILILIPGVLLLYRGLVDLQEKAYQEDADNVNKILAL